jgi:hypothetical protein
MNVNNNRTLDWTAAVLFHSDLFKIHVLLMEIVHNISSSRLQLIENYLATITKAGRNTRSFSV